MNDNELYNELLTNLDQIDNSSKTLDINDFDLDEFEKKLEEQLESEFKDVEELKEELKAIKNPDNLGKVILGEVWQQFGNQIGLDMTNETLIQQYDREHPESYSDIKNQIMQDPAYIQAKKDAKAAQQAGELKDAYTGKDLTQTDSVNIDHVIPRERIFNDPRRKQADLSVQELANKETNLAATNEALNKSKGAKTNSEYIQGREQREKDLKEQYERHVKKIQESNKSEAEKKAEIAKAEKNLNDKLAADDKLMLEAEKKATKAYKAEVNKAVAKNVAKKAGMDALKTMAISALFTMLKEIMNGLVRFIKAKKKTFKGFLDEMKEAVKRFFSKILNVLQTGASSVIGTILSEIFGPIVSMFKKLASIIKQGVASVINAVKYLSDPANKDKPMSFKVAEIGEIFAAALAGIGAIALGEVFEKVLMTYVPIMNIQIPLLGSLANLVGLFLASVVCGVIGAIVINLIERFIAEKNKEIINSNIHDKKNEILSTQRNLIVAKKANLEKTKMNTAMNISQRHNDANSYIIQTVEEIESDDIQEIDTESIDNELYDVFRKLDDF